MYAISNGGYLAEQAFRWLAEIDLTPEQTREVIEGLVAIEGNKTFSQRMRHAARRHRIQMERRQEC